MHPVLKESILSKDIAWCPNDKARIFVRSMGFVGPLWKMYMKDGIVPSGTSRKEGVLHEKYTISGT